MQKLDCVLVISMFVSRPDVIRVPRIQRLPVDSQPVIFRGELGTHWTLGARFRITVWYLDFRLST